MVGPVLIRIGLNIVIPLGSNRHGVHVVFVG